MHVVSTYHDASLGLGVIALLIPDHPCVDHLRTVGHHLETSEKSNDTIVLSFSSYHLLNQSLLHKLNKSPPGEGTSYLEQVVRGRQRDVINTMKMKDSVFSVSSSINKRL